MANATGIGPALRRARLLRGKSIEEASRETRIRADYIQALERERFDSLLGDVYARGFLRSYSSYLGLDSDKVVSIYTQHFGLPSRPAPSGPAPAPVASSRAGARGPNARRRVFRRPARSPWARRRGLNWPVLVVLAAVVVVVLAAAGLFSRAKVAPPPATPGIQATGASGIGGAGSKSVTVSVLATDKVSMIVLADGHKVFDRVLLAGEGQDFDGQHLIEVRLAHGGTVTLVVNGHTIASPGSSKQPYDASFGPASYRSQPSAASSTP